MDAAIAKADAKHVAVETWEVVNRLDPSVRPDKRVQENLAAVGNDEKLPHPTVL